MKPMILCLAFCLGGCGTSPSKCPPGGCNTVTGLALDSRARGCEVLLQDGGGKVDHVDFGTDVTGRWLRQGDKVAAAFVADKDEPIGAVQVVYAGDFSVLNSHCYGSRGEELAGATVHR